MVTVLLVIHLIIAIALVAVVLLQRSEGGALGIGGGGGMSGFLTGRSTANLLTRTTAILAAIFIITSLALTKLSGGNIARSIFEQRAPTPTEPVQQPSEPQGPTAPIAR
jgi:preprotein translocase subunit SecG